MEDMTSVHAFLWGTGSVLNVSGQVPDPHYLHRQDETAIRGNFERVGVLLKHAMAQEPAEVVLEADAQDQYPRTDEACMAWMK
jgi:hypothetical protein